LENPEIAYDEFKACDHLGHVLEQKGFQVENGVGNVDT
jgi:metal-dependent amidase/aminoacylase/carboxypeptidase family protein